MNELKALESMGLTLPSPAYILGSLVFGIFGYVAFNRGRKSSRMDMIAVGLVLMLYPYAVSETWMLWAIGTALAGWVSLRWN
jgi:hypothetical protein